MTTLVLLLLLSQTNAKDVAVAKPEPNSDSTSAANQVKPSVPPDPSPSEAEIEQRKEADRAERDVQAQETMAAFTRALFWLGFFQFLAAVAAVVAAVRAANAAQTTITVMGETNRHTRTIDRAYISTATDEPLEIEAGVTKASGDREDGHICRVLLYVTNHGNTPARITDTYFAFHHGKSLPPQISYSATPVQSGSRGYLVKEENIMIKLKFKMPASIREGLQVGSTDVWLYGYADYVDAFGTRHRAGWARLVKNDFTNEAGHRFRHGLRFDPVSDPYNYDRPRDPSEGNDWSEK